MQSKLKWFIYPGTIDRLEQHDYDEDYRNNHNVITARLTKWLQHQPVGRLPWSIVNGGIYAEMLGSLLRPSTGEDGVVKFVGPVREDSIFPLIPLEMYGARGRWMLENLKDSIGKSLSAAPILTTFPEIANAFESVNSVKAEFQPVTIEEWMERITPFLDPDKTPSPRLE